MLTMLDDPRPRLVSGRSARPALTQLVLLMQANPDVAASILNDPLKAASAHPQYALTLNEYDQEVVCAIQSRVQSLRDFLCQLAEVIDGPA